MNSRRVPILVLAAFLALALGSGAIRAEGPRAPTPEVSAEEQLALKHEPILLIAEQSGECNKDGSPYDPAPVEILFDNPDITLKKQPGKETIKTAPSTSDLFGLSADYYLDYKGNPKRPGCGYEQAYRELTADKKPTIYAHVATEEGTPGIAIEYWFYYYFNHFANKHEGDWEMIQVMFDNANTPEEALQKEPTRTVYSSHAGGELANWTDSKLKKEGSRPIVYVGRGSDSSYYSPAVYIGVAKRGQVFGCDHTNLPTRRVDPEVVFLPPDAPNDPASPLAWMSYAGLWGEDVGGSFSGPQGPPVRPRWDAPFEYANKQRDFSDEVPNSFLGIDPVGFICTAVNAGSQVMILFGAYPWLVGGSAVIMMMLVGSVLVNGAPAWLTGRRGEAKDDPVLLQPGPGFLGKERRLKQLVRTSLRVYRSHWRLWVVTGLVMVPISLVVMLAEQLLGLTWAANLVQSSAAAPFLQIVGMSAGALISATVVATAVFASARRLDEGRQPSVIGAYREVGSRAASLAGQVALTSLVVVGLLVTVIGIPLAVNRLVAWAVAGQAVMIEDRRPLKAMSRSAALVRGHWWRVVIVLTLISLFVGLPGPLIAFAALIFLKPPVMQFVYPILSLLYVMVLFPLGFLCSVLLYGDLRASAESRGAADGPP